MENSHINKIKELVKQEYGYDVDSPTRKREVVEARAMFYVVLRNFTNLTLAGIARTVGKNHATILHGIKNFNLWREQNKYLNLAFKNVIERLETLDEIESHNELRDAKRQLLKLTLENMELKKKAVKSSSISKLLKDLPTDKVQEIEDRVKLMVDSYSWKYKDKIKVYQANATQVL